MWLTRRVESSIKGFKDENLDVACEPIWAVGTGKEASSDEIKKTLFIIKELMNVDWTFGRLKYGGSASKSSINELANKDFCDGFPVGNASLNKEFQAIIDAVTILKKSKWY